MLQLNDKNTDIKKLIELISGGDDAAFKIVYDSISGKMFSLCLRLMEGHRADAEDCFQEGCIRLYKNIGSYRGEGSFEGWIRMIFLNCCITHYRLRGKDITCTINTASLLENKCSDYSTALETLYAKDVVNLFQRKLPDGRKKIVQLYCVDGYQHTEIARMLGCTESNCKSQLHRARKTLAVALQYD